MDIDFYLQRALARLGEDKKYYDYYRSTPSNLKLLEEYLRRLRLWMERLNMSFERWWQASNLAVALDPQIRVAKEVQQWAFQITQQRPYPYGVDAMTFENALHWETLKQQRAEVIEAHHLPDPYEPFILLLKRGGGFIIEDDILHLTAWDLSLLSRELPWLTRHIQNYPSPDTPLVSLDEAVLNTIDSSAPALYGFLPEDNYLIYAGQNKNGEQYLVTPIEAVVAVIKFSPTGELVEVIEKDQFQDTYDQDLAERYDENIAAVVAELETREMQITAQKFFLPKYHFGIKDLPALEEEFLADRSTFSKEEYEHYEQEIEDWLIGNKFVLQLGPDHDYWLNIEGYVTDT